MSEIPIPERIWLDWNNWDNSDLIWWTDEPKFTDDVEYVIATKCAELEAQVEKLRGVLVCVNNNCERRDKKIAKLEAENEQLRQALDNLYSVIDKRKMYIIKDSITNELNEAQAVLETAKGKVSDEPASQNI